MSSNSNGNSTMSSVPAKTTKRVAKKTDVTTPVEAVVPVVAAPAPAPVATATKVSKAKVAAAVATTTVSAPDVTVPAPEAQAVAAPVQNEVVHVPVAEEIDALIKRTSEMRDALGEQMKALTRLQKRVARDLKEAGKRRRKVRKEGVEGEQVTKRPTIFTTPLRLKDDLATFLGKTKGAQMTPAEVTKAVRQYIDQHGLKDKENGHMIHPDAAMRRVLGVSDGDHLTYRNIQKYLYKQYELPESKAVKTA